MISVGPDVRVLLVFYSCRASSFDELILSDEHELVRAFTAEELEREELNPTYRNAINSVLRPGHPVRRDP